MTSFLNEIVTIITKNNIQFKVSIQPGSLEMSLQILVDYLSQISQNPLAAGTLASIAGNLIGAVLDRKKEDIKIKKTNSSWDLSEEIKRLINKHIRMKLAELVELDMRIVAVFKDVHGEPKKITLDERYSLNHLTYRDNVLDPRTSRPFQDSSLYPSKEANENQFTDPTSTNRAKIISIQLLKEDLCIFRFSPIDTPFPDFKPGQTITIGLNVPKEGKIVYRPYFIASPPEYKKYIEILVRFIRKPVPGRLTTESIRSEIRK